jgi:hypothetical protein
MEIIVARWPNNSFSVLAAPRGWDEFWLFDALDEIGSPLDASITVISGRDAVVDFPRHEKAATALQTAYSGSSREWHFREDICERFYASLAKGVNA